MTPTATLEEIKEYYASGLITMNHVRGLYDSLFGTFRWSRFPGAKEELIKRLEDLPEVHKAILGIKNE